MIFPIFLRESTKIIVGVGSQVCKILYYFLCANENLFINILQSIVVGEGGEGIFSQDKNLLKICYGFMTDSFSKIFYKILNNFM